MEASVAPIHLTVEGLGNPLRVRFTAGQRHDSTQAQAPALLDGLTFEQVIADRGSAGAAFSAYLHKRGGAAVIPPQKRAKSKGEYDTWLYRERHLIACCFNTLAAHSPHSLALRQTGSLRSWLRSGRLRAPTERVTGQDGLKHRLPLVLQWSLKELRAMGKEAMVRSISIKPLSGYEQKRDRE